MHIVIAGGSGFLGSALAARPRPRRPRRRRPVRAAPAGGAPSNGRAVAVDAGRLGRPMGGVDRRRGRGRQPGRRVDCRAPVDRRAEATHPRQPRPGDAKPRRAPSAPRRRRRTSSSADRPSATTARSATNRHRRATRRARLPRERVRAVGSRSAARRPARRAWSASAPAWCSHATAARCRRCCRRSGSAPAGRSDRAGSTGRGFTCRTGSISCASRFETPAVAGSPERHGAHAGDQRGVCPALWAARFAGRHSCRRPDLR